MGIEAKTNQYWIAPSAVTITLNALGNPNRTHGSVASGAVISCYIDGIEGLGLDNGRNPKRWPLTLSPTYFNSNTQKYVYVAIPRSETIGTQAVVVFPSEELDLYGKNTSGTQVGSSDYYYIWLRGIISSTNGSTNRTWVSVIDIGSLGTYEDIMDMSDGDWYSYSKVNGIVTFLKNIVMRAGTTFQNLILGNKELTGVATATTSEEYINSDALVATPNFISQHYLRKDSDDTAQGFISFVKGLAVKGKNLLDIIRSTDGLTDSDEAVLSEKKSLATFLRKDKEDSTDHHVTFGDGITTPNAGSSDFVSGEKGWRIYEHNGKSYLEVDNIEARGVFRATVLDIKRRTYSAGTIVGNMANGKVVRVTPLDSSGVSMGVFVYGLNIGNDQWLAVTVREEDGTTYNVAGEQQEVSGAAAAYKLDFLRSDDEVTVTNDWHVGDMARCQEINVQSREMGEGVVLNRNRSWWRVVTEVGTETLPDGRECAYIIVSNAGTQQESYDASEHPSGRQANQITVSDGINTTTCWAFDDRLPNDAPMVGDDVCQEGHVFNENEGRQNLKVDKIEDLSLTWYQGIGYDKSDVEHQFSLNVNQPLRVSPDGVVVQASKFYLGSPIPSNQIENKILTRRWLSQTTSQIFVPRGYNGDYIDYQNMQPYAFTIRAKRQVGNDAATNVNDAKIKLYGYISTDETEGTAFEGIGSLSLDSQDIETLIDAGYRHLVAFWLEGENDGTTVDAVEITIVIQGEKGVQGRGIVSTNIYYKASASAPSTPSGAPASSGWSDNGNTLITSTNARKHLYESTCTTYSDGTYSWTRPQDDGLISDLAATEEEFALADSGTVAPSTGWSASINPTAGKWIWSRTKLTFKSGSPMYVSVQCVGYCAVDADVWTIGADGYWYKNGVKYTDTNHPNGIEAEGKDGTGVEIKGDVDVLFHSQIVGSQTALEDLTNVNVGECYTVTANKHLYFYDGTTSASATNPVGWRDLGKFSGDDGASSYMHIAYADNVILDAQGNPTSCTGFTVVKQKEAYDWVGLCTNNSQTDPTTYTAYEWNKVKGATGNDGRGISDATDYYKASQYATGVTAPLDGQEADEGWYEDPSDAMQNWNSTNKFLWHYEKVEYDAAPQFEYTTPAVMAIWTKDGKGISNIINFYKISTKDGSNAQNSEARPSTDPETGQIVSGWTRAVQNPTEAAPFLWNYEKIEYTEGAPSYTDPHVISHFGKDGNDGKDAEFYRFKPIVETAAAYLEEDTTTHKLTTSRKVRLNLQYWVYKVVGDVETRVMNLSGFVIKYLRHINGMPTTVTTVTPSGNTTDGQYFDVQEDPLDEYKGKNEGKNIDVILYKVTGIAPSQTETELDRRIVPLVFDAQTAFEIDTENGHIGSIVQGHTAQINQQATEISQTQDAITLTAMRSGTDNLIPNSLIKETSSAYGFAHREGISLTQGKTYTLSANGRISDTAAANNQTLQVYVFRSGAGGAWIEGTIHYVEINATSDSTDSTTFTCGATANDYQVMAFMYPSGGDRTGTVTLNWVKLEEGSTATEYHSDADSAYSKMKITSDAIEQEVNGTKTRLDEGGFTVTGDTKFEGDVTIQGTLTGQTSYLEENQVIEGYTLIVPPDMTILDMKEKSSVTVSAKRAADSTIPTLILPMWNKFLIGEGKETPEYRIEGTRITITNPYNPDYATWRWFENNSQQAGRFNDYGLGLLEHCVLIVADPRLVSLRMYQSSSNKNYTIRMWCASGVNTSWIDDQGMQHDNDPIPADGYYDVIVSWRPTINGDYDSLDSYQLEKMQGNFICEGIRGRQLLLLPGQSVELVSRKGNIVHDNQSADYLYWQVVNAKEFESIRMWFRQSVSQSGSPLAPVWGNALENRRWTVGTAGFSESGDQYQSAIFSAPQMGNGYAQPATGTYPERQLDFDLVANQIRANEYDDH